MSSKLCTDHEESRLTKYKVLESLSGKVNSIQLAEPCESFTAELNQDSTLLNSVIADLNSAKDTLRLGSCNLLGRLLDQSDVKQLDLTSGQRLDIINHMVLNLTNASSSKEATLILWSLKRDALVSMKEMKPHLVSLLYACQRAASDIKSESASRPSYAVAAAILHLISRLYVEQKELMQENTNIWLSLTLTYCCHGVSRLLRTCSQEVIELAYDHLLHRAIHCRSLVSDISENIIANITNLLHKQYDEPCKLFAIKLWGLLVTIMGEEMERAPSTDLYITALAKAFSKNYPLRQAAAFRAWKLLIQNFSTEYLLQGSLWLRLCVPLTKSNRVEERDGLIARFECWWAMIRKLGADMMKYYTEVCNPLIEFCLPVERSMNKPGLVGLVKSAAVPEHLLQQELLAVTLQLLGEYDTVVLPNIKLGFDQRRIVLNPSIIKHCGKDLLHAVKESFNVVNAMDEKRRDEVLPGLLRAHSTLVKAVIDSTGSVTNDDLVRSHAREIFSLIINSKLMGRQLLDLISPAVHFKNTILSSTAYTPAEGNSYIRTPASYLMEKAWSCCSHPLNQKETERFCEYVCALIERGCPASAEVFIQEAVQRMPLGSSTQFILRPLQTLSAIINSSLLKVKDVDLFKEYLTACEGMVEVCPRECCDQLVVALTNGLETMFCQWPDTESAFVVKFWTELSDKLLSKHGALSSGLKPSLISVLHNSPLHLRNETMDTWKERVNESAQSVSEFRLMVSEIEEELRTKVALVTGPPPAPDHRQSANTPKSPTKKRLVIPSPSRSPLRSVNKKQLVTENSPVHTKNSTVHTKNSPVPTKNCPVYTKNSLVHINKRLGSEEPESFGLLNGLITPEKRRKLTELTPDKSLRVTPTTRIGRMTPTKRSGGKQKRMSKINAKIINHSDCKVSITSSKVSSQCIENSPEQSQVVSQSTSSQQISEETGSSPKMELTLRTPPSRHPTRLHGVIASTPGAPLTSPIAEDLSKNHLVSADLSTPLKLSAEDSALVPVPLCSVRLTRTRSVEKNVKEHATNTAKIITSRPPRSKSKKLKLPEASQNSSQSSQQSLSSQSSTESNKKLKLKKNKIPSTENECNSIIERQFFCKVNVVMVADSSVDIISCSRVKAVRSQKSKVKHAEDVFCLSQESQEASSVREVADSHSLAAITVDLDQASPVKDPTQQRLFEGISSHDSFFDPEETPSLHNDTILDSFSVPISDSLEFSSGEVSKLSSGTIISSNDSKDITPIPPRLGGESQLYSDDFREQVSQETSSAETDDDVLLISAITSSNVLLEPESDITSKENLILIKFDECSKELAKNSTDKFASNGSGGNYNTHNSKIIPIAGVCSSSQHIEQSPDHAVTNTDACMSVETIINGSADEKHSTLVDNGPTEVPNNDPILLKFPEKNANSVRKSADVSIDKVTSNESGESLRVDESVRDMQLEDNSKHLFKEQTKEAIDDDITMSQFDEEMEVPVVAVENAVTSASGVNKIKLKFNGKVDIVLLSGGECSQGTVNKLASDTAGKDRSTSNSSFVADKQSPPQSVSSTAGGSSISTEEISKSSSPTLFENLPILTTSSSANPVQNLSIPTKDLLPPTLVFPTPTKDLLTSAPSLPSTTESMAAPSPILPAPTRDPSTPTEDSTTSNKELLTSNENLPSSFKDLSTPSRNSPVRIRDIPTPTLKMTKGVSSSPSRAQLLLKSSRSSQILAKSISTKSANSSPIQGMNHVDTLPATPRSSKLSTEALELDCTPIYSPTTGSILKRKHRHSPSGSSLKKVKFRLPITQLSSEKSGSNRKLAKRSGSSKERNILDMYSSSSSESSQKDVNDGLSQSPSSSPHQQVAAAETHFISESESADSTCEDPPIAAEYTESTIPIDAVVGHLNRPNWHANLRQCLISQGITTVGALARLTETDIDPLPIAKPKLSTTLKAFKKSGASKNPPKPKVTSCANKLSKLQLKTIMQLVTDKELSNSQLGSQIRSIFTTESTDSPSN